MTDLRIETIENGSITSTPGFAAAGVACGIKGGGALDLALVSASVPCVAAAVFTTNAFKAAPVLYDRQVLAQSADRLRAVAINSGCANACTGQQGMADAGAMAGMAAEAADAQVEEVMVMSTGVIGAMMPMDKIAAGMREAGRQLDDDVQAGHAAARAIMTTDTRPKEHAIAAVGSSGTYTIAGMAKGSGMIHPNMATMLSVVTTDARIAPALAQEALNHAVAASLNMVTVDGDTSTNDTLLLMASGLADMDTIEDASSEAFVDFCAALTHLAVQIAKMIARDGEGATRFVEIVVQGARNADDAKRVAMSVAKSPLVKTAIYGQDANWGRIVCAVGYSGVDIDPDRVSVWLGDLHLVRDGAPYNVDEERASQILAQSDIKIVIDLGAGGEEATVWTCDLTHRYVDINAHYRT